MGSEYIDGWEPDSKPSESKFPILKVKQAQVQVRVLDKVPFKFKVHWDVKPKTPLNCAGDNCLFCRRGHKVDVNAYVNVIDRADNNRVKALVLSVGIQLAITEFLTELHKKGETEIDLRNYDILISRTGTSQADTRFKVGRIPNIPLMPDGGTPVRYNFAELVKPLTNAEMEKILGNKPPPTDSRVRDFSKPPAEGVVSAEVRSVLKDDDDALPI